MFSNINATVFDAGDTLREKMRGFLAFLKGSL